MAGDRATRNCVVTTWGAADATIGKVGLVGVIALGSAALGTITILDGTAIKMVIAAQITANNQLAFYPAIAFSNLIVDNTGTASYSVIYQPIA